MKLYFAPGACSLSAHIALREAGAGFDLEQVDLAAKRTKSGADFRAISPMGYVPALQLDDGSVMTEASVIAQYVADTNPAAKLAPAAGSKERYALMGWLNFIATELHKGFSPYTLIPQMNDDSLAWVKTRLTQRVELLRTQLGARSFIFGDSFTIADAYAFWALRAFSFLTKTKLDGTLKEYLARMTAWPSVQAAVDYEKRN